MKIFRILFTVLSISFTPSANAAQVSQVELSASAASQSIQMMDQRFDPIYEDQPYQATCHREVYDHTETSCHNTSDRVCHGGGEVCSTSSDQVCNSHGCTTIPRRSCHQSSESCTSVPRRECSDHSVYRTESYSCTKIHAVQVGQRLVKTFQHNVEVSVDRPELLQGQRLVIAVQANENQVSPALVSSFSLNMLTAEVIKVSDVDSATQESITSKILVHVDVSTAAIGKILSSTVQDLALSSAGIRMKLPGIAELSKDLTIAVNLTQRRTLFGSKTLFDDSIDSASLSLVAQGEDLMVVIPLDKMQIDQLKSKRHSLSISVSLKRPALRVLNNNDLSVVLDKKLEGALSDVVPN